MAHWIQKLDEWFPFFIFFLGFILTSLSLLIQSVGEEKFAHLWAQDWLLHKLRLGLVFLAVGTIWSLQNLWLSH